ncbi:MAG: Npt1/Npt2 family nucleotide transporter [Planctomycetota bacterium]|nr:Npt1/Npt2 family nucleotide transporter [Planctomycetota bacterium]MDA0917962.1 Npt1/Npt2 family nucleotide transporter [Planctomycetota bacterium]MDA1159763.1 Npt1/Npt2 family nucleotide transporter [Planctomycetota bacterium]
MLSHRIKKLLRVPPDQQVRTGLLFLFSFGMTGAYVGARSDADAVFLARLGIEKLPAMILISASGVAIVTALYAKMLARLSLQQVVFATHMVLAVATLTLALTLKSDDRSLGIPVALYLLAELRGAFGSIQFATLLNELFRNDAPERASGIASSGSTISAVVLGSLIGWLATQFGATSVLYMIVVMDVFAGFVALRCRRNPTPNIGDDNAPAESSAAQDDQQTDAPTSPLAILKQVPLARYLAGIVCLKTIVVLLIEFEWKSTAAAYYSVEDELAGFFGVFYAAMALLTGCVQLLVTSRFLARFGVQAGLASFPASVTLVLSTIFFAVKPTAMFWCLTLARGCDVLRRSLTDTAVNILYWPLGPALRRQVIALNGGWVKPLTEAFAAVLLIPLTATLSDRGLALTIASLCVVWLIVIYRGRNAAVREPKQP